MSLPANLSWAQLRLSAASPPPAAVCAEGTTVGRGQSWEHIGPLTFRRLAHRKPSIQWVLSRGLRSYSRRKLGPELCPDLARSVEGSREPSYPLLGAEETPWPSVTVVLWVHFESC